MNQKQPKAPPLETENAVLGNKISAYLSLFSECEHISQVCADRYSVWCDRQLSSSESTDIIKLSQSA